MTPQVRPAPAAGDSTAPVAAVAAQAVARALRFLAGAHLPHGEFPIHAYASPTLAGVGAADSSPFATTFVLNALADLGVPGTEGMMARAADFLLSEREAPGVWRYWTSRNPRRIGPDADDTACAAHVLERLRPGSAAGSAETLLAHRTSEGAFPTWLLRTADRGNDVDAVVNANVLLFLGEREETRAAAGWVRDTIEAGVPAGSYWYYCDDLALHYAASRAFRSGVGTLSACRDASVRAVLARRQPDGSFGNELQTAMALCALANYGAAEPAVSAAAVRWLVQAQRPDGKWVRRPFYAGPEPPSSHAVWWGSAALTTALVLEALAAAQRAAAPA